MTGRCEAVETLMPYDSNNAFARILKGELPCIRVCENLHTLAFMDTMPQADGHVLVIPKEPACTVFDLSEEGAVACIKMARKIAIAVKVALQVEGAAIMQLSGMSAGQTVPHVHFHIIPRNANVALRPHASMPEDPAKLKQLADRIISALAVPRRHNTSC
jgi:histidine triad (HIT) family protein